MRRPKINIQSKCCCLLFLFFTSSHLLWAQWDSPSTLTYQVDPHDDVLIGGNSPNGDGVKALWNFDKAAFRGGYVSSLNPQVWNKDSLGHSSFAFGWDVTATGDYGSICMGVQSLASGNDGSIALGYLAQASGQYGCTAIGNNTRASGNNGSTALGYNTRATGWTGATALGSSTIARGDKGATAMGQYVEANGETSICIGSGYNSQTYLENNIPNSLVIGFKSPFPSIFVAPGTINYGGYVGIGTTSPTQPLHVDGAIRLGQALTLDPGIIHWNGVHFQGWTGSAYKNLDEPSVWGESSGVAYYNGRVGIGPGTSNTSHQLHVSGDIAVSGVIIYPSDRRLKSNIQPIQEALSTIRQLQPTSYTHKPAAVRKFGLSDEQQFGFIAQDVKKILPNLVVEGALVDEQGLSYLGMDYKMLIPILVKALKESDDKTNELKKLVDNQSDLIEKLEIQLQNQIERIDLITE